MLSFQLTPGYVYGPAGFAGVRQWTPDLQIVADQSIPNDDYGASVGAAITHDGLVLSCFYLHGAGVPEGNHLLALGANGQVVHDVYLGGSLHAGSGIAEDASGQILVGALDGVHLIAPDFSSNTLLPVSISRPDGIAIDAQGRIYVVDEDHNQIVVLSPDHHVLRYLPTERTPGGAAISPDGDLYFVDDHYQTATQYLSRLVRVDIQHDDTETVVLHGLPFMSTIAFAPDGSFYLTTSNGRALSWYSPDYHLLANIVHSGGANLVDNVAYYPSEPPGWGPTSTTITAVPDGSAEWGQAVTLTATISGGDLADRVGETVTFVQGTTVDDTRILGTGTLDASGQASLTTTALERGNRPIRALYRGDSTYAGSNGSVGYAVLPPKGTPANILVNDPQEDLFAENTESETSLVLGSGSHIVVGFNDSGSNLDRDHHVTNHYTGYSISSDGGARFADQGTLPASVNGDLGDPVLARDNGTGRIYFATLSYVAPNVIQVFRSDDDGNSFMAPVNAFPGFAGGELDKDWLAVDNFAGPGQGNVYVVARDFGTGNGI